MPPAAAPPPPTPLPGTEGARSERPARAAVLLAAGARLAPRPLPPGCAGTKSGQRTWGEADKGAAPAQLLGRQGVLPPRSGPPGDSSEWGPDRPRRQIFPRGDYRALPSSSVGFSCLPLPAAELLHPKYAGFLFDCYCFWPLSALSLFPRGSCYPTGFKNPTEEKKKKKPQSSHSKLRVLLF